MQHGQITLEREQSARLLSWGIRFFLAAALTASQTPDGYAPFALGCVAAAGPGGNGIAALLGAGAGALAFLEFGSALPFLASAVLIAATASAFRETKLLGRTFLTGTGVGWFAAVSGIYVLQSLSPLDALAPCASAAVLVGLSAWFCYPLLSEGQERLEPDSLLFLASAVFLAMENWNVLELSVGRMLLCLLLLYASYQRGASAGAAIGLGMGLAADLCAGDGTILFSAAYGLGGLLAGYYARCRRSMASLVFLGAAGLVLLPLKGSMGGVLFLEAGVSAGLFLILPGRIFGGKRVQKAAEPEAGTVRDRLKEQLNRTATALRDLYDSMSRTVSPAAEENPAIVFDRAAERVCRGCALCDLCWQKEYTMTFNAFNDATPFLLERGRALPKDFPGHFSERCIHLTDLLTAINGELSAFLLRQQYRRQLEETRRSAQGQYAQLSELLTATAAGIGRTTSAMAPALEPCRIGAALRPRKGKSVCGDTLASFQTDTGLQCLLLADGMGSGEAARRESALACRLLRQFLEAGIEPEAALKTLNSAMALRSADSGAFTTIDLLTCRSETGETSFYKFGAAPSYLKKGGAVRRVTGGSLPAGLRGNSAVPDITQVKLEPGSFAVMISDGVADSGRDEWLQDLLAGWSGEDPQELAGLILTESIRQEGLQDDCGIQVLYLPRENEGKIAREV